MGELSVWVMFVSTATKRHPDQKPIIFGVAHRSVRLPWPGIAA